MTTPADDDGLELEDTVRVPVRRGPLGAVETIDVDAAAAGQWDERQWSAHPPR